MMLKLAAAGVLAGTALAVPASAQIVGSSSLATLRQCDLTASTALCDGTGPGQQLSRGAQQYGGGVGFGGWNTLTVDANRAWSFVAFDAAYELPTIRAATQAAGNVRMNINTFAFQSYVWDGAAAGLFSISGDLHIVDSSVSPVDGSLPGGSRFTSYVGIWDPSVIAGLSTPQELFSTSFYKPCGEAGVLGTGGNGGTLAGGEATYGATTAECSAGSLILTPGQEVLVVVGLQLPVNRGGWADSSATFTTKLGEDLTPEQLAVVEQSIVSAIGQGAKVASVPEPSSWAMLIAGFGLTGAVMRRRRSTTVAA